MLGARAVTVAHERASQAAARRPRRPGPARRRPRAAHDVPGRRAGGAVRPRSSRRRPRAVVRRRAGRAASPVLVVGQGLEPARRRRRLRRPGRRARRGFADDRRSTGTDGARPAAAVRLRSLARRTAAAGLTGLEWAVGVPGSVGGAVRMNAGGHGSDMAATLATGPRRRPRQRRGWWRVGRPTSTSATAGRRSAPHQVVVRAELALAPGDRADAEAEIAEIVRWRREHQPGGQNAGSVFTNPPGDSAGRLIDAAGLQGPAASAAPRCRPSTPTSSRPTTAAAPTTSPRSSPRSGAGCATRTASSSTPSCGWSASRDRTRTAPPASERKPRTSIDPRIRARRVEVQRDEGRKRLHRLALVGGAVAIVAGLVWLTTTPLLDVDSIRVEGADHTDQAAVLGALQIKRGDALLTADIGGASRARCCGCRGWRRRRGCAPFVAGDGRRLHRRAHTGLPAVAAKNGGWVLAGLLGWDASSTRTPGTCGSGSCAVAGLLAHVPAPRASHSPASAYDSLAVGVVGGSSPKTSGAAPSQGPCWLQARAAPSTPSLVVPGGGGAYRSLRHRRPRLTTREWWRWHRSSKRAPMARACAPSTCGSRTLLP